MAGMSENAMADVIDGQSDGSATEVVQLQKSNSKQKVTDAVDLASIKEVDQELHNDGTEHGGSLRDNDGILA